MRETRARSFVKAVSWRVSGTVSTMTLVYLWTGRFEIAAGVGLTEFVSKIGIFYVHERIWARIPVRTVETPENADSKSFDAKAAEA